MFAEVFSIVTTLIVALWLVYRAGRESVSKKITKRVTDVLFQQRDNQINSSDKADDFWSKKRSIALLCVFPLVSGCSFTLFQDEPTIFPQLVTPSEYEQQVLRSQIPEFYVRFTEQQRQLEIARDSAR